MFSFLVGRQCAVPAMPHISWVSGPAVPRILILASPLREWGQRALCAAAWSGGCHVPVPGYLPSDEVDAPI